MNENAADISALSFEEALKALESIVSRLESGSVPLEESIELYSKGTALKDHCETRLKTAQMRIDKLTLGSGGEPTGATPFEEQG